MRGSKQKMCWKQKLDYLYEDDEEEIDELEENAEERNNTWNKKKEN